MGNTHLGLEIRLVFIIFIFLAMMAYVCVGVGNLTKTLCSMQERLALLKFKQSVRDDQGMLSSWGVGDDCCMWERIGCDDVTGRVVSLNLRSNDKKNNYLIDKYINLLEDNDPMIFGYEAYLVGDEVNSCLAELVNLKHLDLSGNDFQRSSIPEFIGSFKQLRYLNLSSAGFIGNIPHQIGNLSNLKVLDLSYSLGFRQELMTHDMSWISGLSKLEHLDLSGVDLSRARHVNYLRYITHSLLTLSLSSCQLSMAQFGSYQLNSSRELSSIKHLDLSDNSFGGRLPDMFLNMTSLTYLDLSLDNLSMAHDFEKLLKMIPFVSQLRLSSCSILNVSLSPTKFNLSTYSNIQHLDLSQNEIEGNFPTILTNISSLLSLDLSWNKLNSYIPVIPNLLKLDISLNKLDKIDDVGIWRQCHLKELNAEYNILEGEMIGPSTNVSKCSQNALEVLYLSLNILNGLIPYSLGRFTNLRVLDLSDNQLTGVIPEAIGELRLLQGLYLSNNQFNSFLPQSLGGLTALREIYLNFNGFTGPIPVSVGKLTSLRVLSVASNLLNGTIPNSIGQLTELQILDVSNNSLQGVVSEEHFANLSELIYMNANSNNNPFFNISREWIPPFQLKVALLGSCKIEDGFPQWFQNQRKLEKLVLSNASIYGPLPTWLRLLPNIYHLDLSHNKLTGPLSNLPFINAKYSQSILLLQDNLFTGLIPRWLCQMTGLQILDLSRNNLIGKIPSCLWNMYLKVMLLSSNRLSGVIPSSSGRTSSLLWLQLNDNNLSGELPRDLGYFTSLSFLDLGENKFSGEIPTWIGENITRLVAFRLHKNNFTGRIPQSVCKFYLLRILDLAHNNLAGAIPRCFGELQGMKEDTRDPYTMTRIGFEYDYGNIMQVLKGSELDYTSTLQLVQNMDLSSNKLVGEIPEELSTLQALIGLNLSYNHLIGGIPKDIGNMMSLFSLDLSANELTGKIPSTIAALNFLSHLNLSHNNLSGQIPTGNQLQTLTDPSIYAGNTYLCGEPLPKGCFPRKKPPTTPSKTTDDNDKESKKLWSYLDIICGFVTGFWGIIGVLLFKKQWRDKLFLLCEKTMDKIYVGVVVRVLKMKKGREAA